MSLLTAISQSQIGIEKSQPPHVLRYISLIENRLNDSGKGLVLNLIQKNLDDKTGLKMSRAGQQILFKDTILKDSSPSSHVPLSRQEKKMEFYLKDNQNRELQKPRFDKKLLRGKITAERNKLLRLRRIKEVNNDIHRHTRDNRNRIWMNSLAEEVASPFDKKLSADRTHIDKAARSTSFDFLKTSRLNSDRSNSVEQNPHLIRHQIKERHRPKIPANIPHSFALKIDLPNLDIQHDYHRVTFYNDSFGENKVLTRHLLLEDQMENEERRKPSRNPPRKRTTPNQQLPLLLERSKEHFRTSSTQIPPNPNTSQSLNSSRLPKDRVIPYSLLHQILHEEGKHSKN